MSKRRKIKSNKLRNLLAMIRPTEEEYPFESSYHTDPRQVILDPETVSKDELDRHHSLCEDLDLLEEILGREDDFPF